MQVHFYRENIALNTKLQNRICLLSARILMINATHISLASSYSKLKWLIL